jgi:CubicO group peptidase (beta-lactamase class C family)
MRKIIAGLLMGAIIIMNLITVQAQNQLKPAQNQLKPAESQVKHTDNLSMSVDAIVQKVMEKAMVPGISVSVTDEDNILFERGYGVESIDSDKPMTENSLSGIGSVTKSFTALAILQQVEKGKIKLDDPVIKYIPEFKTQDEEKSRKITIRMLLNNTSGLRRNVNSDLFSRDDASTDYLKEIKLNQRTELLFDPGTGYGYSNEGFVILGYILETVTGTPYTQYVEQNIFKPLAMVDTTTDIEVLKREDVLYGHMGGIDNFLPAEKRYVGSMIPAGSETRSSVHELARYLQMLLKEGRYEGQQLISTELFRQTLDTAVIPFSMNGMDMKYGYGWMHDEKNGLQLHEGSTMSMSSMVIWDKQKKIGVSILYNVVSVNPSTDSSIAKTAMEILGIYTGKSYPSIKEERLKKGQQKDFDSRLCGKYISEDGYTHLSIEKESKLIARFAGTGGISECLISQLSDTQLLAENVTSETILEVARGNDNSVISISHEQLGRFIPEKSIDLTGYKTIQWNKVSFLCPVGFVTDMNKDICKINTGSGEIDIGRLAPGAQFYSEVDGAVKETNVRETYISGKKIMEKIYITNLNGKLIAHIFVKMEGGSPVIISGIVPFEELTDVRMSIIKPIIESFK